MVRISFWLSLTGDQAERCQSVIDNLAHIHHSPSVIAHVTLGTAHLNRAQVPAMLESMRQTLATCPPLMAKLSSVHVGDGSRISQTLTVECEWDATAHQTLQALTAPISDKHAFKQPAYSHLSLVYKNTALTQKEVQQALGKLNGTGLRDEPLVFANVHAIEVDASLRCTSQIHQWQEIDPEE